MCKNGRYPASSSKTETCQTHRYIRVCSALEGARYRCTTRALGLRQSEAGGARTAPCLELRLRCDMVTLRYAMILMMVQTMKDASFRKARDLDVPGGPETVGTPTFSGPRPCADPAGAPLPPGPGLSRGSALESACGGRWRVAVGCRCNTAVLLMLQCLLQRN